MLYIYELKDFTYKWVSGRYTVPQERIRWYKLYRKIKDRELEKGKIFLISISNDNMMLKFGDSTLTFEDIEDSSCSIYIEKSNGYEGRLTWNLSMYIENDSLYNILMYWGISEYLKDMGAR